MSVKPCEHSLKNVDLIGIAPTSFPMILAFIANVRHRFSETPKTRENLVGKERRNCVVLATVND